MTTEMPPEDRQTFAAALGEYANQWPNKPCFVINGIGQTAKDIDDKAATAARALRSLGLEAGDVVAIFAKNSPEWVYVWLAAPRLGAIVAFCNTALTGDFLAYQLRDCSAKVVFVDADLTDRVIAVAQDLPELKTILVLGNTTASTISAQVEDAAILSMPHDVSEQSGLENVELMWNDPACIVYTSGTTGPSKGVVASQHYLLSVGRANRAIAQFSGSDVFFGALPLFHLSGLGVLLTALTAGATGVLDEAFPVSTCWSRIREVGATGFSAVGPMMVMLWNQAPRPDDATLPLRVVLCAPIPIELHGKIEARFGFTFATCYGLSEAVPLVFSPLSAPQRPGSAGIVNPNFDVRIFDEFDNELPPGSVGEIVCRPLRSHVMFERYFHNAEATVAQSTNLWFHTGDLGRFDDDGYFYLVDRKKDAIRRRGENISSFEVEQAILTHPAIAECAAFAVPSPLGEDDVMVALVLRSDAQCTYPHLMDHCVARMPYFALPRYLEFIDELPKNAVGRVQKFKLREQGVRQNTWDREQASYAVQRT